MKILQIIQRPQLRGVEIFTCQLSEELNRADVKTDVLFLFGNAESLGSLDGFNVPFIHLNANEKKRLYDFKAYKNLYRIIETGEYDVVQANAADTLKYAAFSKMLFGWKQPIVFRNASKMSDFIHSLLKKLLNQLLVNKTAFVASVSEECRKDFVKAFRYPPSKTQTITIGVNPQLPPAYDNLQNIGVVKKPVYLSVAGFVPEKNHAGLLNIFSRIKQDQPEAQLVLIGSGKLENEIKNLCKTMQLEDAVFFTGPRKDVLRIMPLCDALLIPSLIEGLPGVILESFLCKLPVVAYGVGGIGEVVKDGAT
ncbi:MAG TPA: glycosyltransferase, partial [Saprospiraceae bacterium]|nr:glycosyltransferase [Saprospiraceae bacterium]